MHQNEPARHFRWTSHANFSRTFPNESGSVYETFVGSIHQTHAMALVDGEFDRSGGNRVD